MAMTLDTAIKFTAKLEGQGLDQLKRNLQGLSQQSTVSKRSLDQLYTATQKLGAASGNTIAGLQKTVGSLKALRDQAEFGSRSFKLLTRDIEAAEARLRKFQGAASGQGGLSGGLGGAGAALAGITSYFSGRQAVQLASTAASFGALEGQLTELNKAAGLTNQTAQTLAQDGLGAVIKASRASGVPIENLSSQLLKLTAAAQGTIFQGAELNQVFVAINRYAAAFGVSVEDTDGIIRAFQQTLSKQKLSLEEINGQFGDRAPTALRVFAEAARMNVPEFTKAVADGKLTVNDLVDLLPALTKQAELLEATISPLKKAQRDLNAEMAQAGLVIGRTLEPAVTGITKTLAGFLKSFNEGNTGLVKALAVTAGAIAGVAAAWLAVTAAARAAAITQAAAASLGGALKSGKGIAGLLVGGAAAVGGGILASQLFKGLDEEVAKARKELEQLTKLNLDKDFGQGALPQSQAEKEAAEKRLKDELKIRQDTELKLRDFRQRTVERAQELERDLAEERMRLERTVADNRKRLQQQAEDIDLERRRRAARAAGQTVDTFDLQQRLNDARRKFDQERQEADQQYSDQKRQLDLKIEDYKISVARGISNILQDAADKMAEKMVGGAQQAAGILTGNGSAGGLNGRRAMPGSVGRGQLGVGNLVSLARSAGFTGNNAAIMAAIAMAESGGRSSAHNNNARTGDNSYGLWQINMLGGMGPERRRAFGIGSNEALFDPAVNANAARQVFQSQGFGAWSVYRSGAYKQYLPAAQAAASNGSARMLIGRPGASSAVPGMDVIEQRRQEITGLLGTNRDLRRQGSMGDLLKSNEQEITNITAALDDQSNSVAKQLRDYQAINELQRSGLSPAVAQAKLDAEAMATTEYANLQTLRAQLVEDMKRKDLTKAEREELEGQVRAIDERIIKQPEVVAGIVAQNQALERQAQIQERNKALAQGIAGAIGNGIGSAIDLLIDGTENWGNSLRQIGATILKDIARQIAQTMVIQPIVKGITKAFGFADGGIMTANGPVPLRTYARGGIANSPQLAMFGEGSTPEAYVPLPDGRRIPVKMQGTGGAVNVTVNVDAQGTQVQGNPGQGEALGRAVSQAVQAELIRQRRPGGLLAA